MTPLSGLGRAKADGRDSLARRCALVACKHAPTVVKLESVLTVPKGACEQAAYRAPHDSPIRRPDAGTGPSPELWERPWSRLLACKHKVGGSGLTPAIRASPLFQHPPPGAEGAC
jgi:hypothetical protein